MTVVAWDGKMLAADRRTVNSGLIGITTKIHRIGDLLVGTSGPITSGEAMIEWVRKGRDAASFPASQVDPKGDWAPTLVIEADGAILLYDNLIFPTRFQQRFHAIGSGRDFAMAAMHLGHSAAEAVAVACEFQSDCGNGVDVLALVPVVSEGRLRALALAQAQGFA